MGNPFGRNTVIALTNKSGGAVAAGDFVYIDTANNTSFTTGTTGAYTKGIGIAQQTIASNAVGLVMIEGYASLVNVNASVTRGNFLKSHTVVKQGTDAGSSRIAGTCGMFLSSGTTPDAIIWQPDLGAASGELVASSVIWTTAGQVAIATGSTAASAVGRPELIDNSSSGGSDVTFTSPTSDNAALTLSSQAGYAQKIISTEVTTRRHAYVSSAIGTGDFDLRCRLTDITITIPHTTTSTPFGAFFVADSSLTTGTRLSVQVPGPSTTADQPKYALAVVGTAGSGQNNFGVKLPIILRIKRVGTTVTFYCSTTEGINWTLLSTVTSSLNIGRIGVILNGGSTGTQTSEMLVHWIRSF